MPSTKSNPIDAKEKNLASLCMRLTDIMVMLDKVTPIDDSIPMYEDVSAELMSLKLDLQDYVIKHW